MKLYALLKCCFFLFTGKQVCVVDAAVLLEARWTDMVHEVWVTIIPDEEVIMCIITSEHIHQLGLFCLNDSIHHRIVVIQ